VRTAADGFEPRKSTLALVLVLLMVVIYLLFGVNISSREAIRGRVIYAEAVTHLAAPIDGYVEAAFVQPGQRVRVGDRLILVRHGRHVAESGIGFSEISKNLERRTQLSSERAQGQRALLLIEQGQMKNRLHTAESELDAIGRQIVLIGKSIDLHAKSVARSKLMIEQGFYSPALGEEKEREAVDLELKLQELRKARLGNESLRNEITSQLKALDQRLSQLDLDAAAERQALEFQLGELEMKNTAVLIATTDGIVDGVGAKIGAEVRLGQRLVSVKGTDDAFRIELDVPSTSAGFLQVGQRIDVKYDAFPYLKYGFGSGEIVFVGTTSAHESLDQDRSDDVYFRAVAKASLPPRLAWNKDYQIRDQMGVVVEVVVNDRPLYQWIFDPLIAARRFVTSSHTLQRGSSP
jgi:membrane fusion protein